LLAVPFVLYSQPAGVFESGGASKSEEAHRRYAEIMRDVEGMIDEHSMRLFTPRLDQDFSAHRYTTLVALQNEENPLPSKLKMLVPGIGPFFTRLPLEKAFNYQNHRRCISSRRFVAPSFNDVRLILNSAQIMAVTTYGTLQLATFDGDVTLYDDGQSLEPDSPVIPRILGEWPLQLIIQQPGASH
jgi:IMP and pyridine-specific 5'-nucleotidase